MQRERWNMIRMKDTGLEEQQIVEPLLKEKAMQHLLAACDRRECLKLIGMAYDRITYYDNMEQAFKGLYGRTN